MLTSAGHWKELVHLGGVSEDALLRVAERSSPGIPGISRNEKSLFRMASVSKKAIFSTRKDVFFQLLCFNLSLVSWYLQSLGIYCGLAINFELISAVVFRIFSIFCWWIWPIPGHFLGIWLRHPEKKVGVSPRLLRQGVQQQSGDAADAGHGKLGHVKWAHWNGLKSSK